MSLICDETTACEKCIDCQKIMNHQYADIIEYNGQEESIKKNTLNTFKKHLRSLH